MRVLSLHHSYRNSSGDTEAPFTDTKAHVVIKGSVIGAKAPLMILRRLAVINKFSTSWLQSHVLCVCRREMWRHTQRVSRSYDTSSLVLMLSHN